MVSYLNQNKTVCYLLSHTQCSENENVCRKDIHKVIFEKEHGILERHTRAVSAAIIIYYRRKVGRKEARGGRGEGEKERGGEKEKEKREKGDKRGRERT